MYMIMMVVGLCVKRNDKVFEKHLCSESWFIKLSDESRSSWVEWNLK